ncbi:MAG: SulP family inorganic anion transporter [Calditerrivibrio sp.]|uniref:SulP family inorganic anion transporter n=1 Tax=Calditerrivibrio sp. TaxID=2792612 RepID=UPI003D10B206
MGISISKLKGDLFGGITAGIVALPLALAFGVASGMGAKAGLYGAIFLGFFAALLGGTKTQISGPTGPMTVVMASIVTAVKGDVSSVVMIIMLAGIFQIILGIIKLGSFIRYIPYPVVSGFMSGIGIIIIILQINPALGSPIKGSPILTIASLGSTLSNINLQALFVFIITLLILYLTPKKIGKIIPTPLLALIIVTPIANILNFDIQKIGNIPQGVPSPIIPSINLHMISIAFTFSLSLAILGAIDSLLTSLVADSITRTKHDPNRELIGQGVGNALAGLFGGIPGAGATMRTVINVKTGGNSRLSGIIHAIFLFIVLIGAGKYASYIPMALLSGILIKVGVDIIDYKFLKLIKFAPKHDVFVMAVVFFLTVLVDLIVAVGVGLVLASILLTYRMAQQMNIDILNPQQDQVISGEIETIGEKCMRIIRIDGPFFFGSMTKVVNLGNELLDTKVVLFDCSKIPFIDSSAVFALEDIFLTLNDKGIKVLIYADNKIIDTIKNLGITNIIPHQHLFNDLQKGVDHAKKHIKECK